MTQAYKTRLNHAFWLLLIPVWIILYFVDWVPLINNDFVQTVVGFMLFIAAGAVLGTAYYGEVKWTQLITFGFVVSSFVALCLGIVSIVLGLSSDFFFICFKLIGTIGIILLFLRQDHIRIQMWESSITISDVLVFVLYLASTISLFVFMYHTIKFESDSLTSNALITEFAGSNHMSLQDPFLGTGNSIRPRLWLMGWLLDQSLIIRFSHLNILQISHLIQFSVVILVQIAIYELIRRFNYSRKFALTAIIFTCFVILSQLNKDELGIIFAERLIQDKVITAWLITPIYLTILYDFLTKTTLRNIIIFIILSFVTVNFHAVMFFYIGLISGIFTLLYVVIHSRKWFQIIVVALIIGVCAMIPFALRQLSSNDFVYETSDIADSGQGPEQFYRIALSEDRSVLYGISPSLRDGLPFTLLYIATVIAIMNIRQGTMGYIVIAATTTLLAVSNPITAPLIAKFITPFQIWRAPWIMPFGAASVILAHPAYRYIKTRWTETVANMLLILVVLGLSLSTINTTYTHVQPQLTDSKPQEFLHDQVIFNDLVQIQQFIRTDSDSESIMVFADNPIMYFIPSMDANIHTFLWRNHNKQIRMDVETQIERETDHNRFYGDDITLDELNELIDQYDIQYFILSSTFLKPLNNVLSQSPRIVGSQQFEDIKLWIVGTEDQSS